MQPYFLLYISFPTKRKQTNSSLLICQFLYMNVCHGVTVSYDTSVMATQKLYL